MNDKRDTIRAGAAIGGGTGLVLSLFGFILGNTAPGVLIGFLAAAVFLPVDRLTHYCAGAGLGSYACLGFWTDVGLFALPFETAMAGALIAWLHA